MADAYLDHGAYASNIGTTPTWGVPQEGDGTATTAATASSAASVVFASVPTTGTFSLCGVTVSVTGVLNAASVDAAANALATNINATTTAVGAAVARGLPQLRNLVFARGPSGGAPAGTCQIMMRVGSTSLNHATNANVAAAQTLSPAATLTQFAGGSGGCWGWFWNAAALGVSSSIPALHYGLLVASPLVSGGGFAFAAQDTVHVRTGGSPTVNPGNITFDVASRANKPGFVNLLFDTNVIWTSDPADGQLTLVLNNSFSTYSICFGQGSANSPNYYTYVARALGGYTIRIAMSTGGMAFELDANATGAGYHYENVKFVETNSLATNAGLQFWSLAIANFRRGFVGCEFDFTACQRVNLRVSTFRLRQGSLTLLGNTFKWNLSGVGGAALTVPLISTTAADACGGDLVVRGNRAEIGQPGELRVVQFLSGGSAGAGFNATMENNEGMGLVAGSAGIVGTTPQANNAALSFDNLRVGGGAHYEDRRGYWQWVPGQPVLSAQAPDGVVWSWVGYWTNAAQIINPAQPWYSPACRTQVRLATGVRTLTLEMLLDSVALANLATLARIELSYTDSTGKARCERLPITLAASSASWSNVAGAPYNTWVSRKATVTTTHQVPLDSILAMRLHFDWALTGSAASFAFDPEPAIS